MSGVKRITGISSGSHRSSSAKISTLVKSEARATAKMQKLPKPTRVAASSIPHIKASHGIAGTSNAHHAAQVNKAMGTVHVKVPRAGGVPGVPIGNPAPGPSNAFE